MRFSLWKRGREAHYALAIVVLAAGTGIAHAQESKRLGFVVGISEYGPTAHPTALQDAALVAQSLKGAGFEVQEAANLKQDEFRAAFREFTQKAAGAGPDAVLAVYVAGVSLQDGGENILIPAGANLRQRTDLALEGLRLNDFIRALGATPAKARLMMVDTGYTHPYGQLVAEGGRGLALVDTLPGMAISFNQSPGLAAALPQSNYGPYAMALAEALREPGLNANAMFERVRLRVHDLSAGLQTPWDAISLPADFVLNAPPGGAPLVTSAIPEPARPLREVSAEDAYARALALDSIGGYSDFLKAHPQAQQARRVRALLAARREALFWQRTRRADNDRAYWTYLKRYPRGAHSAEAEARLTRLSAPIDPPPAFDEVVYDDLPPPPPEEVMIYDEVVVDDGWRALPPPMAYPAYVPPPPVAIIDLEPPPRPTPWATVLPAVGLGVGAAILANRMWRRPPEVRPTVAPPVVRPPRPAGGWAGRAPVVLPANPNPPPVVPAARPAAVAPAAVPPAVAPAAVAPAAIAPAGVPPAARTGVAPGAIAPQAAPGVVPPRPGAVPAVPPGAIRPAPAPVPAPPPAAATAPPPAPVVPPTAPPPPPGARRATPQVVTPPAPRVQTPGAAPQVQRPGPMIGRPPLVRQPPPVVRPAAPVVRQAPPVMRQSPPVARPAAPVVRQPPPVRQAPPQAFRPPPPRAAPPPAARPAPKPCTPQMHAAKLC